MITKIILKNIASYKEDGAILETDQKVNLIYGLNGSGKSTFSNYFLYLSDPSIFESISNYDFSQCSVEPSPNQNEFEFLVYNQKYIEDNFYESPHLNGIFSLSKGNKKAQEAIDKAQAEIVRLSNANKPKYEELETLNSDFKNTKETVIKQTWLIKKKYYGGDRVLEYCLRGCMRSGEDLFNYIRNIEKPSTTIKEIDKIKNEVLLMSDESNILDELPLLKFDAENIEQNSLLQKAIVSSGNSNFSSFIKQIGNSDWVQSGMRYISYESNSEVCPFCQQKINKQNLLEKLTACFDESYKQDKNSLDACLSSYNTLKQSLKKYPEFDTLSLLNDLKGKYSLAYNALNACIQNNTTYLENKIKTPSEIVSLTDSSIFLNELNSIILEANRRIKDFNEKIKKKEETLDNLKNDFWNNMRNEYDSQISNFINNENQYLRNKQIIETQIKTNEDAIIQQKSIIVEKQKDVVNRQDAIDNINIGLTNLGIDSFSIESYDDALYQIKRGEESNNVFKSLSEGEKMIISFLYFIEECKGKKSADESEKKKIVVIDDPISSLSHIYVFNIGRFIVNEFLRSDKYEQIFVLTHSLYFFYELAKKPVNKKVLNDIEAEKERKKEQKLFRINKTNGRSDISIMKYNEIQNDYQVYWSFIKNDNNHPALLANCMRNIIDYFYGFVLKDEFNNVFQKPALRDNNRFDAFCRYMDRESHSDGQNIFDIKEFDYDAWKEALKLVFEKSGYEEHYKRMMK